MLTPDQLDRIGTTSGEGVRLVVHAGADAELGLALADTARQIAGAGVGVAVDHGDGVGLIATPAMVLHARGRENTAWSAAPDGLEAGPFAEHLAALQGGEAPPDWTEPLADLTMPAELLVFVAPTCPHCPNAVRVALAAARASDQVRVSVLDVQRHQALAARFEVTSVPLTVLDGGLALTGVPRGADLVARICERGGAEHDARLLTSLIDSGRLAEAAEVVAGDVAPFVAVWQTSTTSSRMGLMLVAENLLERDAHCLDGAVPGLMSATTTEDAALRGDTADLLGQIGEPSARPVLEKLLADPNPDVVEIAGDALAALRSG